MNENLKQIGAQLALRMKTYIQAAVAPLLERLTALEARAPIPGEKGLDGKDGLQGKDGRDGVDGSPATLELVLAALEASPSLLEKAVGIYLAAHPPPAGADGKPGKDGRDGIDGKDGAAGADGLAGKDGAQGLEGAPGRDGKDGRDGQAGKDGRDGLNGKDGLDGLGFDDLDVVLGEDLRTISLKFLRGDRVKSFDLANPIPLYRGIFDGSKAYAAGDIVTKDGSMWYATEPTKAVPGAGATPWVLCVKQGREGKTGPRGSEGPKGLDGKDGRDLTALGMDGRKW